MNKTYISVFHKEKEVKINFDVVEKVSVKSNLTVCSFDTIRGRNKTDHAYMQQKTIDITGSFSERTVNYLFNNFKVKGDNKLKIIKDLFLSFIQDTRLFYIYTKYKLYKDYALKNCSISYTDYVGTINVKLSFLEVLFINNKILGEGLLYSPVLIEETITNKELEELIKNNITSNKIKEDKKLTYKFLEIKRQIKFFNPDISENTFDQRLAI